ncbi:MAG: hypothetical protein KAR11_01480, partial [Phycisphaerae bacterium]|nr:hypothetical protein [Phycisphaerae bacterium]
VFATTFFPLCHARESGHPENVEMTREMFYIRKPGSPIGVGDDRKENIPIMPPRLAVCHCEERSDAATGNAGGK